MRFIANSKLALSSLGLDAFLTAFKDWQRVYSSDSREDAEPVIRELAAEQGRAIVETDTRAKVLAELVEAFLRMAGK